MVCSVLILQVEQNTFLLQDLTCPASQEISAFTEHESSLPFLQKLYA